MRTCSGLSLPILDVPWDMACLKSHSDTQRSSSMLQSEHNRYVASVSRVSQNLVRHIVGSSKGTDDNRHILALCLCGIIGSAPNTVISHIGSPNNLFVFGT